MVVVVLLSVNKMLLSFHGYCGSLLQYATLRLSLRLGDFLFVRVLLPCALIGDYLYSSSTALVRVL